MRINIESCVPIHFGLSFVFAPAPPLDPPYPFTFQRALQSEGVDFPSSNRTPTNMEFVRPENPLVLRLTIVGPQVIQLLLLAQFPKTSLEMFKKEAGAVCQAYLKTWPAPVQFVMRDAAIQCLYSCVECDHSFKYIWEHLLHQELETTKTLGKALWGGGLRFVMPANQEDKPEPTGVEVKIESFLSDTTKLFVETRLIWPAPIQTGDLSAMCGELMDRVDQYMEKNVVEFVKGSNHDDTERQ